MKSFELKTLRELNVFEQQNLMAGAAVGNCDCGSKCYCYCDGTDSNAAKTSNSGKASFDTISARKQRANDL